MNSFAQLPLFTISASIRPFFSTRPDKPRLINLVAEDNAIEDAIYHLHRALNSGRVDLERFLRVRYRCHLYFHLLTFCLQTTRVLAEEQFMKRALIGKIKDGLPMAIPTESNWS